MAVSWASNTNTNHIQNFCEEGFQVNERGGWPEGIQPIKTSADSNGGNNTQVEPSIALQVELQVDGDTRVEPSVALQVESQVDSNTQVEALVALQDESQVDGNTKVELSVALLTDIEYPEPILHRNVDCYVSGLLASFPRETLNKMVDEILIGYPQSEYATEQERPILHQRCGRETWSG